jgi:membrane protein implicated in regulation of membrane protease activity
MRLRERALLALLGTAAVTLVGGPTASAATVTVSTTAQLNSALAAAAPGTVISLAANTTFTGNFKAAKSGTSSSGITLTGPRSAVLKASGGRGLELTGSYWTLSGFTITGGQKGLMALGVHHTLVDDLKVTGVGHEGIHFQYTSSDNVVRNSEVTNTGLEYAGYGEGIYFGSANSNWPGGTPDKSDRNKALNNKIGPDVRAESIDVKEGTTGGELTGNTFDGTGQSGEHFADSWVDLKGNGYLVSNNTGSKVFVHNETYGAFEVHQQLAGWGSNNTFSGNTADVQSSYAYGFYVAKTGLGNKICGNNTVTNAGKGFANVPATDSC